MGNIDPYFKTIALRYVNKKYKKRSIKYNDDGCTMKIHPDRPSEAENWHRDMVGDLVYRVTSELLSDSVIHRYFVIQPLGSG